MARKRGMVSSGMAAGLALVAAAIGGGAAWAWFMMGGTPKDEEQSGGSSAGGGGSKGGGALGGVGEFIFKGEDGAGFWKNLGKLL